VSLVIRPAAPGDGEGLAQAALDLAEQYGGPEPDRFQTPDRIVLVTWLEQALAEQLSDDTLWLVAEADGSAVGDVQAQLHEPGSDAAVQPSLDIGRRRVHLDYLAVQAGHRSRGIGGLLLQAVEQWARKKDAELLLTDTNLRSNLGAVEFYEKHRFVQQAVILRKVLA
jgi:GNAT superfamily N-acetyltransferase